MTMKQEIPVTFADYRARIDAGLLRLFADKHLRKLFRNEAKLKLGDVWIQAAPELGEIGSVKHQAAAAPMQIHQQIVEGLPGEALFISSAMLYDSLQEALPLFNVTAKTARNRLGDVLQANEGEIALRIGRVFAMAMNVFGSLDAAREYLRTPNFALGGAIPRNLLSTAAGEQMVLSELEAQAEGAPV